MQTDDSGCVRQVAATLEKDPTVSGVCVVHVYIALKRALAPILLHDAGARVCVQHEPRHQRSRS
jgi:hypothetical protein